MGILAKSKIWKELKDGQNGNGLVITPITDKEQIGDTSVDVHLGHEFILFKRASAASFDIKDKKYLQQNIYRYQEKVRISRKHKFILHPRQLVLGATIEYISLPKTIAAHVSGRSTWGRTGLIIATATEIAPGFKGCITLELVNAGEIPLVLYPGLCVAQIVLERIEGSAEYAGRYKCPTGPEFPQLVKELNRMSRFHNPNSRT